jgi:hypothetical protein
MNIVAGQLQSCKSCGKEGTGNFCNNCGQTYNTKRISIKGLLHDLFHFFTHLEKGFGYTVKQLVAAPGTMQREYVDGIRNRYQKPFSMFFICLSVNALARYFIFEILDKVYHQNTLQEANYFHEYQVFVFPALIPVISLITLLLFWKEKYNYAETGVLQLYLFSFILLAVVPISLLKFIWPGLDTAIIELPIISIYSMISFTRFYNRANRWLTLVKGLVLILLLFFIVQKMEDIIIDLLKNPGQIVA